ncbi:MAG: Rne/Rng family ribonuclease [Phycisphaerales bacterium]
MEDNFEANEAGDSGAKGESESQSESKSEGRREPRENRRGRSRRSEANDEGAENTNVEGRSEESEVEASGESEPQQDASADSDAPKEGEPKRKRTRGGRSRTRKGARSERSERGERAERRASSDEESPVATKGEKGPHTQMIINYVPGEECRVAIVEDGKLEELHTERFASASHVGNIYVGKVMNVEPAIQAAFVDFGMGENGFLHVTDLHPRYFPGESEENTTERIGIKTPRRDRPPIQAALRRGDEIIVQVLKEGVGTKGPTLTSYLSIPGRFLVMMPFMDKVGVSRKVEDEEERRKMREILDQLDLPEGFGFILRTAGMTRTKVELKRDLAYLMRLWKDMDKRLKTGGKPRLLYSESDLLVRALRDVLTSETDEVIVDNDSALTRAARYMKIVAPRTNTKLLHFKDKSPVFHAFGIEKQIALIHAREVPLPSGGRLVIDQTEALVAIDVNSGKSRDSRDSETNAYQTNIEAVDEICRQLRLRDMGGIVINDLIDMRFATHRKDIQKRFEDRLKRDRAKSTVLPISEFGILELTRQRMRPSHESVHFTDCPTCRGRGLLQKPDSVSNDAIRDLAALLDVNRVHRVEMVVAPRVAGDLLSTKRQLLSRIERTYGKHVDVRVSEAVAADRVTFYAYEADGADIDLAQLPQNRKPGNLVEWIDPDTGESDWSVDIDEEARAAQEALAEPEPDDSDVHPIELDLSDEEVDRAIAEGKEVAPGDDDGRRGGRRDRGGRDNRRDRGRGRDRNDRGDRGDRGDRRDDRFSGRRDDRNQGSREGARFDDRREGQRRDEPARTQPNNQQRSEPRRDDRNERGDRRPDRPVPQGDRRDRGRFDRRDDRGGRGGNDRGGGRNDRPQREFVPRDDADEWGEPPSRPLQPVSDEVTDEQRPSNEIARPVETNDAEMTEAPRSERPEGAHEPDGEPGQSSEVGPDGEPRRKRRRRRRRRGRGGSDGSNAPQDGGSQSADVEASDDRDTTPAEAPQRDNADANADEWGDEPAPSPRPARPQPARDIEALDEGDAEGDDESVDIESADLSTPSGDVPGNESGNESGDGQRRKRRRRRGGRGRNKNRDNDAPVGDSRPRDNDRPRESASQPPRENSRPEPRREQRPEPRPQSSQQPKAPPKVESQPPSTPTAAPRTLYGNIRRKLTPAQLAKRPKPD